MSVLEAFFFGWGSGAGVVISVWAFVQNRRLKRMVQEQRAWLERTGGRR